MVGHKCNKEEEITEIKINIATIKSDIGYIKDCIADKNTLNKEINKDYTSTLKEIRDYQTKQKAIVGAVFTIFAAFGGVIVWILTKIWGK